MLLDPVRTPKSKITRCFHGVRIEVVVSVHEHVTALTNFPALSSHLHPGYDALLTTDELRRRRSRSCEDRTTSCDSKSWHHRPIEATAPPLTSYPFLISYPTHLEPSLAPYRVPFLHRCDKKFHGCLPAAATLRPVLQWYDHQLSCDYYCSTALCVHGCR